MARIRSIKPEFFTSETLAQVSISARLTFIGLWTYVDDNGVGVDNERLIAAALYALDEDPLEALRRVSDDLRQLSTAGVIVRYEGSGRRYVFITNWTEHQKMSHPGKPRFPRPSQVRDKPPTSNDSDAPETLPKPSGGSPEDDRQPSALSREQGAGSRDLKSVSSPPAAPEDDPPPKKTAAKAAKKTEPHREDVEALCLRLVELMVANECKPPKITDTWRAEARRLLDLDGREFGRAMTLLEWSQANHFWRKNIHSIPTFREKYDRLRQDALDEWAKTRPDGSAPAEVPPLPPWCGDCDEDTRRFEDADRPYQCPTCHPSARKAP